MFDYPKDPPGLEPDTMFGASAIRHCGQAWGIGVWPRDPHDDPTTTPPPPPPAYDPASSQYVGVTRVRVSDHRYWRAERRHNRERTFGPARPFTPEGELLAAKDFAKLAKIASPILKSEFRRKTFTPRAKEPTTVEKGPPDGVSTA